MPELLFKLFDFLLGGILEKWRERRALVQEFEVLKRRVRHMGFVNDLPVELHKLRTFFIEKGLVERHGIKEFFLEWLTNPVVVKGIDAVNVFSSEDIKKLNKQLDDLRL